MKYLSSTTLGCKDIGIRQAEFVAKTQLNLFEIENQKLIKKKQWNLIKKIICILFYSKVWVHTSIEKSVFGRFLVDVLYLLIYSYEI